MTYYLKCQIFDSLTEKWLDKTLAIQFELLEMIQNWLCLKKKFNTFRSLTCNKRGTKIEEQCHPI